MSLTHGKSGWMRAVGARAVPWADFARYCNTAEASDAIASQTPAQTPSDRSNTTVKDAPSDQ